MSSNSSHAITFTLRLILLGKAWTPLSLYVRLQHRSKWVQTPVMLLCSLFVIYWPLTESSIKRSTCVNKRRNSGSRWTSDNYITRCHRRLGSVSVGVEVSWRHDAELRASSRQRALGPQWPTVAQPSQDEKEVLQWSEEFWVKITVSPRLQLTSHTQPTSTLLRIKCEGYIFIKKCIHSFIEVRHYCWLCLRIYLYMYMYYAYVRTYTTFWLIPWEKVWTPFIPPIVG